MTDDPIEFLDQLYGDGAGVFCIWEGKDKHSAFFTTDQAADAVAQAARWNEERRDVYFSTNLYGRRPATGRGGDDDVTQITSVRIDVDCVGPTHKNSDGLALDTDTAMQMVEDVVSLAPTVIVETGGGLQFYWMFDRPHDRDEHDVAGLVPAFTTAVVETAKYKVDSTIDLSRVFRVPAGCNWKAVTAEREQAPRPVRIAHADYTIRYQPAELWAEVERLKTLAPVTRAPASKVKSERVKEAPRDARSPDPETPIEWWNRTHTMSEALADAGWSDAGPAPADKGGGRYWKHPEADHDVSAHVFADDRGAKLWSLSTEVEDLKSKNDYVSPFDILAGYQLDGFNAAVDHVKAARDAEVNKVLGFGEDPPAPKADAHAPPGPDDAPPTTTTWAPQDIGAVLRGEMVDPPPSLFMRTDSVALLYPSKAHSFSGEPEACKGWAACFAATQTMLQGGHVLYVDFEDSAAGVVGRLRALCVPDDVIARQFHYVRPDVPISAEGWADLDPVLALEPGLAILDGVTEAMVLHGLDLISNVDIAKFKIMLTRRLADRGWAVVEIDHVVKNREARSRYSIGGQHKLAGIDGAAYGFEVVRPFGRGLDGLVRISVAKDRPGYVREHAVGRDRIAEMHLHSDPDGGVHIDLRPPADVSTFRPTALMEKLSRHIETYEGLTTRAIRSEVKGDDKAKARALELLIEDGCVRVRPEGQAHRHYSIRPFRSELEVAGK